MPTTSVNNRLYARMIKDFCRGLALTTEPSPRYYLDLATPRSAQMQTLYRDYDATPQQVNDFFQAVRGNIYQPRITVMGAIKACEILPGESFTLTCRNSRGQAVLVRLLKLDSVQYLVVQIVDSLGSGAHRSRSGEGTLHAGVMVDIDGDTTISCGDVLNLGGAGDLTVDNMAFNMPTDMHYGIDLSEFRNFKRTNVADDIFPLYDAVVSLTGRLGDMEAVNETLATCGALGVSTHAIREILDALAARL